MATAKVQSCPYIVEVSGGRVVRLSDAGIVFGTSDPTRFPTQQVARQVAESIAGIYSVVAMTVGLVEKPFEQS